MIDIFVSSGACKSTDLREVLSWAERNQINVELGPEMDPLSFEQARETLLRSQFASKISIHNYFPGPTDPFVMNLGHPNTFDRSLEHGKKIIDLCEVLKIPMYSVHAGCAIALNANQLGRDQSALQRISMRGATELFIDGLGQLTSHGMKKGVTVIMENNVVAAMNATNGYNDAYLFGDVESTLPILDRFTPEDLGILLDVGHLRVSCQVLGFDPTEMLDSIDDYVLALHVSDNGGMTDTNSKIDQDFWFQEHLPRLKNLQQVCLEVYLLEDDEMYRQVEILKSLLRQE